MADVQSSKVCAFCGIIFQRAAGVWDYEWARRKACTPGCHAQRRVGMKTLAERFWAKVDRTGGPDACWLWTASVASHGYGMLSRGGRGGGAITVHRLSWQLHNGPLPDGLCVLHQCDVRRCVNPAHLFVGTRKDNMVDMARKGRQWKQKLDVASVISIRERVSAGETQAAVAVHFGVAANTIGDVVHAISWQHVACPGDTSLYGGG